MKNNNIELTKEDLLNISEMCEHYIDVTSEEIDIDEDLLQSYISTLNKVIEMCNNNK